MFDSFLGAIQALGFNFAPENWQFCHGDTVPIAQNRALYALLEQRYKNRLTFDESNYFALPDLRGRIPVGQGDSFFFRTTYTLGEELGWEDSSLTEATLPYHYHLHDYTDASKLLASTSAGSHTEPADGDYLGVPAGPFGPLDAHIYLPATKAQNKVALGGLEQGSSSFDPDALIISPAGGNQPMAVIQPSLVVNYCICMNGDYPSRG